MRPSALSRRYAEAFADVVEKHGELPRIREELLALAGAFAQNLNMRTVLRTSARSRDEKKALLLSLGGKLDLSPRTVRFLQYLVDKKRLDLLPSLAQSFAEEADRRLRIVRGELVSAMPISQDQRDCVRSALEAQTGARVELNEVIDESLLAGFRVRLANTEFDGSLLGKLQRLKERLAHGPRAIHTA